MDRLTTTMAVSAGDSGRFHVDVNFPDPKPECLYLCVDAVAIQNERYGS
jgi:hypothetical protein